jgi:predicted  nucleic acid-binding Zn-ribbon protein
MMKKMPNTQPEKNGGLKQIREIIFGEVINNLQNQINDLKAENNNLKQQINVHEKNISKSAGLITELTAKQKDSENSLSKTNDLISKLSNELEGKIKELKLSKIDKNQIGQVFIEWGMKVKQEPDA